jgi:hypothetical protein
MKVTSFDIKSLSSNQQVALWVTLHFRQKSFYTSEVGKSKFFTEKGKKAIGGILSALYRNGFIEKVSGGRDKLWKLSSNIEKSKEYYLNELLKVKTYWR